ncbi:MAG: site-2 protease family protein [Oscillospiraceae bacterium]|nr:site-2 protease family protein [Oscillospiraceae bacterium]
MNALNSQMIEIIIHAIVLFTALPVHECAHAWAAHKMGDDTGLNMGRVSLNPFRHLSLWGSFMMIAVGFGWGKPVSVNPNNFKNPKKGMMITSLAGPVSNFIMALLAMIICRVLLCVYMVNMNETVLITSSVFRYITLINLSLGIFNFLPIPPLDGSKIFNAILPDRIYFKIMQYEQYIFIALIIAMYTGLLDKPLNWLNFVGDTVMIFLTNWVEPLMMGILGI